MSSRLLLIASVLLLCMTARGEDAQTQATAVARCDKEVREYLKVLEYIRTAAGPQIGDQVAAGYIDEKSLREVQDKQGSCAAAQLIRTKTAMRRG